MRAEGRESFGELEVVLHLALLADVAKDDDRAHNRAVVVHESAPRCRQSAPMTFAGYQRTLDVDDASALQGEEMESGSSLFSVFSSEPARRPRIRGARALRWSSTR